MVAMARSRPLHILILLAALVVGVVGPCLCALRAAETKAAHDCCDPTAGLKPAAPDCCETCTATVRAPEAAFPEKGDHSVIPAETALLLRAAPTVRVARASRLDASLAASPPLTILRV